MLRKEVFTSAKSLVESVKKNGKLPKTVGKNSVYSVGYVYGMMLKELKKDKIELKKVKNPSNKVGDNINEQVLVNDYLDMNKRFVAYVKKNGQVPSYIVTRKSKKRVNVNLFIFCLAKILVYYYNNKALPKYCIMNSKDVTGNVKPKKNSCTNPYLSKGHCTNQGGRCLGQPNSYYCGVQMIWQILHKFGIKDISKNTIAQWCGTTTRGTDHNGMKTCIAKVNKVKGTNLKIEFKYLSDMGSTKKERWTAIGKLICKSNVGVGIHSMYRQKYGHYECLQMVNTSNADTYVLNSLGNKCKSPAFCGYIETRSWNEWQKYISMISQPSIIIITKQ